MAGVLGPGVVSVLLVRQRGHPAERAAEIDQWTGFPATRLALLEDAPLTCDARSINAAAAAADGQFLFVWPEHTPVPPGLLSQLVRVLERDPAVGAVVPANGVGGTAVNDTLAARLDMMLVRTAAWRALGGLTEDLEGALEDLDFGWRLHLLGYRLKSVSALVPMEPPRLEPSADQRARSALVIATRNLGATRLERLLPGPHAPRGVAVLDEVRPFLPLVEGDAEARLRTQAMRRVPDTVLEPLLRESFPWPWPADALVAAGHADLVTGRHRVVVITPDVIGSRMAGPAIRAWEIAKNLSAEHDVRLVSLSACTVTGDGFEARVTDGAGLREICERADVLLVQGAVLQDHPFLARSPAAIIVDLYDPTHLEVLEQTRDRPSDFRAGAYRGALEALNVQIARADLFLCASRKQRDLWLGYLGALGRTGPASYDGDENLARLLRVVPFGIAAEPPTKTKPVVKGVWPGIAASDTLILWGGGIYNWFDPLTLIAAVGRLTLRFPDIRLLFLGTVHPNPAVPAMAIGAAALELSDRLGLTGRHVFFNDGWVPYEERADYLLEADIGVSCHFDHIETEFSFRTRILDYLWASLPIVTTAGDTFGDLVSERDLGASVPSEDVDALAEALEALVGDPVRRAECRARVAQVAADFTWARVLEPVGDFCRAPQPARDRLTALPDPTDGLPQRTRTWREELAVSVAYFRADGARVFASRAYRRVARKVARKRAQRSGNPAGQW